METAGGSEPSGDIVTVSDTATNIEALTATQISGLAAIGVTAIAATNAAVLLSVPQTSAVNAAGLSVSAPVYDTVTEHNADGSYDIRLFITGGTFNGVAYASYDTAYTAANVA